jgi:NAD-dependent deacetylase
MSSVPEAVLTLARSARRVTVLTGAGMSAESGVPTFRDAPSGLWGRFDPSSLVSIGAWREDQELVWAWHLWLARLMWAAEPNAGHLALAQWAEHIEVRIVTQNIDDLHERAGSEVLAKVHGDMGAFRCSVCHTAYPEQIVIPDELAERLTPPPCPSCGQAIRPGVVWFGEVLPHDHFERAVDAMFDPDLVLVVGTSGIVQPAASLPDLARGHGIPVVEVNPQPSALSGRVDQVWRATAATALPALVAALLDEGR